MPTVSMAIAIGIRKRQENKEGAETDQPEKISFQVLDPRSGTVPQNNDRLEIREKLRLSV